MRKIRSFCLVGCALVCAMIFVQSALALYAPNKLRVRAFDGQAAGTEATTYMTGDPAFPLPTEFHYSVTPIPDPFVIDETKTAAPAGGFNNISHIMRFATEGETTNQQAFGHKFQRSEAWDLAVDVKIETPNATPRKEAGFYFESSLGNDIFYAASNSGHFTPGPGEILVQPTYNVLPDYAFAASAGPLGDYNHNGTVDAADYPIWRDTLGIVDDGVDPPEDLRANGSNEGASLNKIDQADYDVWKAAFGQGASSSVGYTVGDTLNMRMIYTPPVTDPINPDPFTNVITTGKIEFIIRLNGGTAISSGALDFDNPLKGIPDNTFISARAQSLYQAVPNPDGAKFTFSNWDFNGDLPGSGLGSGSGSLNNAPEPTSAVLGLLGMLLWGTVRRVR